MINWLEKFSSQWGGFEWSTAGTYFILNIYIIYIYVRHSHEISHMSSESKFEVFIPYESQNNCLSFHVL